MRPDSRRACAGLIEETPRATGPLSSSRHLHAEIIAFRWEAPLRGCRCSCGSASLAALPARRAARFPIARLLDSAIRTRANAGIRVEGTEPLPPDVAVDDGLTSEEAVAIALWNSPSFQATLADLGIARADLVEAGLLRNPVFSLLFPVGPKQLEWTLQFPFDVIWQRPKRVAAAQLNAQAVGERLVWDAPDARRADTNGACRRASIADRRLQLTIENADLGAATDAASPRRAQAGDISELEARSARSDAARVQVDAARRRTRPRPGPR